MKKADLHIHSYYSDGDFSPTEVVKMAKDAGLACIALTDHDSVGGNKEAVEAGKLYSVEVIPGVEIRTEEGEVVGLFVDSDNQELKDLLEIVCRLRKERVVKVIELLNKEGIGISLEDIRKKYPVAIFMVAQVIEICVDKGYFDSFVKCYKEWFAKGKKFRVEPQNISAREAVTAIKKAGGVAVFAHPWLEGDEYLFNNIDALIELGLDGIEDEVSEYKPNNYEEVAKKVRDLCREKGLIVTKGSDFHKKGVGSPLGRVFCDYSVVEELKKRLEKN